MNGMVLSSKNCQLQLLSAKLTIRHGSTTLAYAQENQRRWVLAIVLDSRHEVSISTQPNAHLSPKPYSG